MGAYFLLVLRSYQQGSTITSQLSLQHLYESWLVMVEQFWWTCLRSISTREYRSQTRISIGYTFIRIPSYVRLIIDHFDTILVYCSFCFLFHIISVLLWGFYNMKEKTERTMKWSMIKRYYVTRVSGLSILAINMVLKGASRRDAPNKIHW